MQYGYDSCGCGYGYPTYPTGGGFNSFAIIVVLFILLIIIGASWC